MKKIYFIHNFIYIPIISKLYVYKNKFKKETTERVTKKRKLYIYKYISFKKLFGFQNKYIIVLNNFLKSLNI